MQNETFAELWLFGVDLIYCLDANVIIKFKSAKSSIKSARLTTTTWTSPLSPEHSFAKLTTCISKIFNKQLALIGNLIIARSCQIFSCWWQLRADLGEWSRDARHDRRPSCRRHRSSFARLVRIGSYIWRTNRDLNFLAF